MQWSPDAQRPAKLGSGGPCEIIGNPTGERELRADDTRFPGLTATLHHQQSGYRAGGPPRREDTMPMTVAEAKAELHRLNLMCRDWIERHPSADEDLFLRHVRELVQGDERLTEALWTRMAADYLTHLEADDQVPGPQDAGDR
jgi:hypothetical protein